MLSIISKLTKILQYEYEYLQMEVTELQEEPVRGLEGTFYRQKTGKIMPHEALIAELCGSAVEF